MKRIFFIMLIAIQFCLYAAAPQKKTPQEKIDLYQREHDFKALASYLNTLHYSTLSLRELSNLEKDLQNTINQQTSLFHHYVQRYSQTGGPAYKDMYTEIQQKVAFASQALKTIQKFDDDAYDAVEYRLQGFD